MPHEIICINLRDILWEIRQRGEQRRKKERKNFADRLNINQFFFLSYTQFDVTFSIVSIFM